MTTAKIEVFIGLYENFIWWGSLLGKNFFWWQGAKWEKYLAKNPPSGENFDSDGQFSFFDPWLVNLVLLVRAFTYGKIKVNLYFPQLKTGKRMLEQ